AKAPISLPQAPAAIFIALAYAPRGATASRPCGRKRPIPRLDHIMCPKALPLRTTQPTGTLEAKLRKADWPSRTFARPVRRRSRSELPRGQDMVGLDRLELSTSPLSGVRSNHLSYRP